ncbi:MAG: PBP1A family penicillin-binding protein [Clostridia bacterium]|nr:PBP1A family penicillin-binding protein [Clostridia bacterium]
MTRRRERKKQKINIYRVILLVVLLFGFIIGGAGLGFVIGALKNMPDIENDKIWEYAITSTVYDKDDNKIDELHGEENRIPVKLDQISPHFIDALLAIEDQRFMRHNGIDLYRIAGAFVSNIKSGRIVAGGSTITQQLVGLSMLDRTEKTYKRKIQEAVIAIKVENDLTKNEILELYINRSYFGHGAYGVEAAAQTFFGKSAKDLDIPESALLAGVIQNPYKHSPILHPEAAKTRRAIVLNAMVDFGKLTQEEANKYKEAPIEITKKTTAKKEYKYQSFIDYVVEEAIDKLNLESAETRKLYTAGYKIYTTLDQNIQNKIEEIYADPKKFPTSTYKDQIIQSAMVVLDPHTGEVKGLIGGRNQEGQRNFNRATQALRQPGSAFKPIAVYGPALEKGYSPATVLDDFPEAYPSPGGVWAPKNYNNRYRGLITMRTAIQYSVNTVAVKMLKQIGVSEGFRFAENLGISSLVPSGSQNDMGLAIALGGLTKGVTPLELTAAYGAFANKGVYVEPYVIRKIEDANGNVVWEHKTKKRVVMSEETAYLMTSMLESVVQAGTGTKARMADRPVAGKTGTTSDNKDAWFVGFTPDLVGTVWLGYDEPKQMSNVVGGGNDAGPIWKEVMEVAHKNLPPSQFTRPAGIVSQAIDTKSGLLPGELTPPEFIATELFNKNFVPTEVSNVWVRAQIDPQTGQLWTPNCPTPPYTGVFLKRPQPWSREGLPDQFKNVVPEDADLELPTQYCTLHGSSSAPIYLQGTALMHDGSSVVRAAKLTWSWPQANENTIYHIHRSTEPGFIPSAGNLIAINDDPFSNSYIDEDIKPGQKYYYRVIAVDSLSNIQSPASNQVAVPGENQTDRALKPPKLQAQVKEVNGQLRVDLSWSKPHPDGEFNYYIFRSEREGFRPGVETQIAQDTVITDNSYTDKNVEMGKTYYYKVIGQDVELNRQSPISNEVKITIKSND